eukprot:c861_g1_i1 orf=385-1806(+)
MLQATESMEAGPESQQNITWETPDTPATINDYILVDGKRLVRPYFFEFIAHVKERWDKKKLVDLFAEEFRQRPLQYYIEAVKSGRILVDGKAVSTNYVVQASQTLSHFVHRHEPPVMADQVIILEIGPDVVTVIKPPSIPVHPCGQYRKNTVVGILQAEHNLGPLFPIHRLDRLVSGLLIFARNAKTADYFRCQIEAGTVRKQYMAKVQGVFPEKEIELHASVAYDAREGRSTVEGKGTRDEKNESTVLPSVRKESKQVVGKQACTKFRRLATDGVNSIVECVPLTGRTHQIRVHLQHLGHPIANDALYAIEAPLPRSQMGINAERAARAGQIVSENSHRCPLINYKKPMIPDEGNMRSCSAETFGQNKTGIEGRTSSQQLFKGKDRAESTSEDVSGGIDLSRSLPTNSCGRKSPEFQVDQMCTCCPNLAPPGYEEMEYGLWLHCVRYCGEGWDFKCPIPTWANLESSICICC